MNQLKYSICTKKCADTLGKILQVLIIAAIAFYAIVLVAKLNFDSRTALYILIIVYILYLICQFCSSTFSFLCNKTNESGIRNLLESLIQSFPTISFYCQCYHYETYTTRHSPPRKGGGRKSRGGKRSGGGRRGHHTTTHRRRVVTWTETVYFPYYSARDVSGLFQLNNSREQAMGKVYIKLEINPEINFADEIYYMDYENFRTDFYNRNRIRDQYMSYRETRTVPGLKQFNFVCIRNQEPCGINACMFVFLTIIPVVELYKCYINSYCLEQNFKIRKIISTRYDLNAVNQELYQFLVPSIIVPDQQYAFQPNNYIYINNNYTVQLPTAEEIAQAQQYKNKIPNYQCTSYASINGDIKVGVVQDDPAYSSVNISDAPPPNVQNAGPQQPGNNGNNMNLNMNMNMNMNSYNNNGMDSNNNFNNNNFNNNNFNNNNFNNNNNNNNNFNNNNDDDEYSDDGDDNMPYSGV